MVAQTVRRLDLQLNDAVVEKVRTLIDTASGGLRKLPAALRRLLETGAWKQRTVKATGEEVCFERFEMFVTSLPPAGLGADVAQIRALVRDDVELLTLIEKTLVAQHGGARSKPDNISLATEPTDDVTGDAPLRDDEPGTRAESPQHGTSRAYTLRRLEADHPELHARVAAGELSANAAAISAGFRRGPDPDVQRVRAWAKTPAPQRVETALRLLSQQSAHEQLDVVERVIRGLDGDQRSALMERLAALDHSPSGDWSEA